MSLEACTCLHLAASWFYNPFFFVFLAFVVFSASWCASLVVHDSSRPTLIWLCCTSRPHCDAYDGDHEYQASSIELLRGMGRLIRDLSSASLMGFLNFSHQWKVHSSNISTYLT